MKNKSDKQIIRIVRNVKAIDFFEYMDGFTDSMSEDTFKLCYDFYKESNNGHKKSIKELQVDGFIDRIKKMEDALANIKEPFDDHYNYLIKLGVKFENGTSSKDFVRIINRAIKKLKTLKEEELKTAKSEEYVPFEELIISLELMFKYSISLDISLLQFVLYIEKSKNME